MSLLPARTAVVVFFAFAFAHFFSALIRAVTATLSPVLTQEFALHARDLGLLAGGYFLGFAITQLPLGTWLDRYGPKRVILAFLSVAVLGCLLFSGARSFSELLVARVLCGVGLSACLMAPLTGYRRWLSPANQLRSNSWMLMVGSLGMVASTLPVQWLVPLAGWRPLFWALAALLLLSMVLILWRVPAWPAPAAGRGETPGTSSYAQVWRHPFFRRMAPVGFFCYGGLVAMQTLWAAPWMIEMAGYSPLQAARGLLWINVTMLLTFWCWGLVNPWLSRRGYHAEHLLAWGLPFSFMLLGVVILAPAHLSPWTWVLLALYCMACSFVTPSQPAVGMVFAAETAGRALSAFNLVVFAGVFVVQWGIGLAIDGLVTLGATRGAAFQLAFAGYLACCVAAYVHFLHAGRHNRGP